MFVAFSDENRASLKVNKINFPFFFMNPEQWKQVKEIFNEAVELAHAERLSFIEQKSGGDALIIKEVQTLLESDEEAEDFIENPLAAVSHLVRDETALAGKKIGVYAIEREIGRGGMGAVFLASRTDDFERRVALKLIKRGFDTDDIIRRFRHERQILAALDHPNITRLLDGGATDDGLPYLVMDYVEGLPLNRYAEENNLAINERLKLFLQICAAVIYAHQNLVIHRDIKPSNILVTKDGTPKLLDFGIAKLTAPNSPQTLERHSTQMMTPEYASPEQILGLTVTTAADIYSLGVVLYELLTGRRPFEIKSDNPIEVAKIITDSAPVKPSSVVTRNRKIGTHWQAAVSTQLKGDLDNIILMAMRKEPERRYSSVEQFAEDINRYLKDLPIIAREDSFSYRASKFVSRNKAGVAAVAGIVAALIGGLATTKRQARIARRQRDKAEKVNQFLQRMLASADPRAVGKDVKVIEVLEIAAESLETDFEHQPEIAADLKTTLGRTYLGLGQFESAEKYLKSALEIRLALFPRKSLEVALSLNNYGKLLTEKGDLNRAEPLYLESLKTLRELLGNKSLTVAEVLENVGYLSGLKARYEESMRFYEEELAIRKAHFGENHPDVARTMGKLGNILTVLDRRDVAEPLHRQSLRILRKLHGREHPDIISSIFNLVGTIYLTHAEEAEALSRESLAMCRKILGEEHTDTAWSLYNLSWVLINAGKNAEAEHYAREALAMRGANLPDKHPVVGSCLLLLGRTLLAQEKYAEAQNVFQECLDLRQKTLPEGHWLLATTRSFLGESLIYLGEAEKGISMMIENYAHLKEKLGANHNQTKQAFERLERFYN